MIEFLLQIIYGCAKETKKNLKTLQELKILEYLECDNKYYRLRKDFAIGVIDFRRKQTIFCNLNQKEKLLVKTSATYYKDDLILAKYVKGRGRKNIKILRILQSNNKILYYLGLHKGNIVGYKLFSDFKYPINLPISQKSLRQLPPYCVIYFDMNAKKIIEILGVIQDANIDEKLILLNFHCDEKFSQESIDYANSFGKEVDKGLYPNRVNLNSLPFYTIDPSSAKDYDDAIYYDFKHRILYIAIADVSTYVALNSPIDIEARKRGFSIYFPHKSYPMLPEALSENLCSLREGKERLAFVWAVSFDKNYLVKESQLFEAIICVHQNISYEEVDQLLQRQQHQIKKPIVNNLKRLYQVVLKLREYRLQSGYCFTSSDIEMKLDTNGMLIDIKYCDETISHQIVEEVMLLANLEAAKMIKDLVGIFRIHAPISDDKKRILFYELQKLGFQIQGKGFHQQILSIQKQAMDQQRSVQVDQIIIKAQNKALYASKADRHFALGFNAYTHFTSPIRRYSDLILHRLLKAVIAHNDGQIKYLSANMDALCALINEQEKKISKVEYAFRDRKYMHWALKNIGKVLNAEVLDSSSPILVVAQEFIIGAKLILEDSIEVEKFDQILVEILDVDLGSTKIYTKFIRRVE